MSDWYLVRVAAVGQRYAGVAQLRQALAGDELQCPLDGREYTLTVPEVEFAAGTHQLFGDDDHPSPRAASSHL